MGDLILMRDVPLSWDCPLCGAKAARHAYLQTMERARCKPDCPKPQGPMPRE